MGRRLLTGAAPVRSAFTQWRKIWRSASAIKFSNNAIKSLAQWRDALDQDSRKSLDQSDAEFQIDSFVFLLHALLTQTILAITAADFNLDDEEIDRLFQPDLFRWAHPDRPLLRVCRDEARDLRIDDIAQICDPFGELCSNLLSGPLRRALGEFYTPAPFAEFLTARARKLWRERSGKPGAVVPTILDPTCGAGVFLTAALRQNLDAGLNPCDALSRIGGADVSPIAAVAARANLLYVSLARLGARSSGERRKALEELVRSRREVAPDAPTFPVELRDAVTLRSPSDAANASTIPLERFDIVVGNPPWLAWDALSGEYRRATLPFWRNYGLFSMSGNQVRYGGAKKDLSGLIVTISVVERLKRDGVFAFLLPRSLFQSAAGEGFRRFGAGGPHREFAALELDDLAEMRLFPYVSVKATALLGAANAATQYPIVARKWRPNDKASSAVGPSVSLSSETTRAERELNANVELGIATPDCARPGAPLALRFATSTKTRERPDEPLRAQVDALAERILRDVPENAPRYRARLGANAAGASGVFWFKGDASLDGATTVVENLGDAGRRKVTTLKVRLESTLLFPLLRWRDVDEFSSRRATTLMLIPQDPIRRRGFDEETMRAKYPLTLEYLLKFREVLSARAAYRRYQSRAPFWSIYNVGETTFAPIKVVWRRMDSTFRAVALQYDSIRNRPVVPQETLSFVAVETLDEADYLAALLNSRPVRKIAAERFQPGSQSFGSPGTFNALPIPRFNPDSASCREIAALGRTLRLNAAARRRS
ncbi:MAG: hypothetical protein ACOX0A_00735 [Thermoguttaceae bacterium]|jgi:hypothetical protein